MVSKTNKKLYEAVINAGVAGDAETVASTLKALVESKMKQLVKEGSAPSISLTRDDLQGATVSLPNGTFAVERLEATMGGDYYNDQTRDWDQADYESSLHVIDYKYVALVPTEGQGQPVEYSGQEANDIVNSEPFKLVRATVRAAIDSKFNSNQDGYGVGDKEHRYQNFGESTNRLVKESSDFFDLSGSDFEGIVVTQNDKDYIVVELSGTCVIDGGENVSWESPGVAPSLESVDVDRLVVQEVSEDGEYIGAPVVYTDREADELVQSPAFQEVLDRVGAHCSEPVEDLKRQYPNRRFDY